MSGPEFFQTGMGRTFYESTMPNLVRQIKRVADRLDNLDMTDGERRTFDDPNEHAGALIGELQEVVRKEYAAISRKDGKAEAEAWVAMVQGRLSEAVGYPVEGAGHAVKILAGRRGMRRAAAFARNYEEIVPGVGKVHQREVLKQFAAFLEQTAENFGEVD